MRGQGAYNTAAVAKNALAAKAITNKVRRTLTRICWQCQKDYPYRAGVENWVKPDGAMRKFVCYGCIDRAYAKQQDNEIRIDMAQHSYSGIKAYETCPRQYYETKVLKLYPREETEATLYGTRLHAAAENFILNGTPLEDEFKFLQPTLDMLAAMPGRKFPELEMAVREDRSVCGFKDPDYWVRGIADLVIVDDENYTARVFDYKSGSDKYPDTDQLMLMALLIFAHFPEVKQVSGGLLFVLRDTVRKYRVSRDMESTLWWKWRERVAKLDASLHHNVWNAKSSGLCRKHCPCIGCEYNGRRV